MNRTRKFLAAGAVGLVVAGAGVGIAVAGGGDDSERSITGDALARASQAALDHTGGGRVTETEVGDEESYYEVEVTLDDGRQVDVQLDEGFNFVGDKVEAAGSDDEDANGDGDD